VCCLRVVRSFVPPLFSVGVFGVLCFFCFVFVLVGGVCSLSVHVLVCFFISFLGWCVCPFFFLLCVCPVCVLGGGLCWFVLGFCVSGVVLWFVLGRGVFFFFFVFL